MNITRQSKTAFQISLSRDELSLLNNCLNEARSAVSDWEFQTRVGATKQEVEQALRTIHSALAQK